MIWPPLANALCLQVFSYTEKSRATADFLSEGPGDVWVCRPVYLSRGFFLIFLFFLPFMDFLLSFLPRLWIPPREMYGFTGTPTFLSCGTCFEWRHVHKKQTLTCLNFYEMWLFLYYKVIFKTLIITICTLKYIYSIILSRLACRFYPIFICLLAGLY